MNDEDTNDKNTNNVNNKNKKKKIIILAIIIAIVFIITIIVAIASTSVNRVSGNESEEFATLKVGSDGSFELSVVNYSSEDDGQQNFSIYKTDDLGNPLERH